MSRYTGNFMTVVIVILVGTSCERGEGNKKTIEEGVGTADADINITEESAGRDAKSPVDRKEAGVIEHSVQEAGMESDSATGDGGSIVQPNTGGDSGSIVQPNTGECSPDGLTQVCYSGPSNTQGVGICKPGTQTCENGAWGECVGMVTGTEESCDGRDEDCDGETDEELSLGECVPENMSSSDMSNQCLAGRLVCNDGMLICEVVDTVQDEQCNGIDDDCDGETDEDADTSCYTGDTGCIKNADDEWECMGICEVGKQRCVDGVLSGQCVDETTPSSLGEQCYASPAVDDDCDGEVDEDCPCNTGDRQECYTGPADTAEVGTCRNGEQICYGGYWGFCLGQVVPEEEICENIGEDNDCDGDSDEEPASTFCFTGLSGLCTVGWTECQSNRTVCEPMYDATTESCNGIDDDCDGSIDEDFDLQNNEKRCGSCTNSCATGQQCCSGQCAYLNTDNNNCGSCGNSCGTNESCVNSKCECDSGLKRCDGACVDTQTDADHCSKCGMRCPSNSYCEGGACYCDSDYTQCDDQCYNLSNDKFHCGICNRDCGLFAFCSEGECECTSQGLIFCLGDGCVDPVVGRCGCGAACTETQSCVDTGGGNYECQDA